MVNNGNYSQRLLWKQGSEVQVVIISGAVLLLRKNEVNRWCILKVIFVSYIVYLLNNENLNHFSGSFPSNSNVLGHRSFLPL